MTTTTSNYSWSKPDPGGSANTWGAILNGATDAIDAQVFKNTQGVVDGSDATAGQIGEVISSVTFSPVTLTNNVAVNVATILLTAGDWDVYGDILFTIGTPPATQLIGGISNVSAAASPTFTILASRLLLSGSYSSTQMSPRPCRVSLAASAPYYLAALAAFASGTSTCQGAIWARRAR